MTYVLAVVECKLALGLYFIKLGRANPYIGGHHRSGTRHGCRKGGGIPHCIPLFCYKTQENRAKAQLFLFLNQIYPKISAPSYPKCTFNMRFRTCAIILYISFRFTIVSFRYWPSTFVEFEPQCSYKIVLIKKECICFKC